MKFRMFGLVSFFVAAVAQSAFAADEMKVSPAVGKPLSEAQKFLEATPPDYKSALDLVRSAQAVPGRTPVDDYFLNQYLGQIAAKTRDDATAAASFEAVADSPLIEQDPNKASLLQNALVLASIAKHYKKAIGYGQRIAALGPLKPDVETDMAVAYYNLHDDAQAKDYAQKAVDATKAAGQQPDPNALAVLANVGKPGATTVVKKKTRKRHQVSR